MSTLTSATDMVQRVIAAVDREGVWSGSLREGEIVALALRGYGTFWFADPLWPHTVEHNVTLAEATLEALA